MGALPTDPPTHPSLLPPDPLSDGERELRYMTERHELLRRMTAAYDNGRLSECEQLWEELRRLDRGRRLSRR